MQDCSNSNIFLKPLFRGNFDPFVNNVNSGANGIVYRKKCCNLHNAFMVRRLSIGKKQPSDLQPSKILSDTTKLIVKKKKKKKRGKNENSNPPFK